MLLLVLTLVAVSLPVPPVAALTLPWQQRSLDAEPAVTGSRMDALQEVSPPAAVQQLQSALAGRQPVVEILAPQDDAVLPPGPWTLKLRVHDWPLVDGGALGVGPHLAVQLDQEPPRIWTESEGLMPELSPGSHRLTIYAALPWGEARKSPGAVQQIRLHRTAPNPLSQPSAGSPQLLAVSPSGASAAEPLLLDWLLLNAPLQDVGGRGTQWRLRVSINGEDVLLDQQSPLWLRGWKPGLNALRLELLDARGEPLNPPFNSLVQEVVISPEALPARWRGETLSDAELAILLGEVPPVPQSGRSAPLPPPSPERPFPSAPLRSRGTEDTPASTMEAPLTPASPDAGFTPAQPADATTSERTPDTPSSTAQGPAAMAEIPQDVTAPPASGAASPPVQAASKASRVPEEDGQAGDHAEQHRENELTSASRRTGEEAGTASPEADSSVTSAHDVTVAPPPALSPETTAPAAALPAQDTSPGASEPSLDPSPQTMPPATASSPPPTAPPSVAAPPIATPRAATEDGDDASRVRPGTALGGRARDLVNDDGTLRRPERRGPLAGLRERLQP